MEKVPKKKTEKPKVWAETYLGIFGIYYLEVRIYKHFRQSDHIWWSSQIFVMNNYYQHLGCNKETIQWPIFFITSLFCLFKIITFLTDSAGRHVFMASLSESERGNVEAANFAQQSENVFWNGTSDRWYPLSVCLSRGIEMELHMLVYIRVHSVLKVFYVMSFENIWN